MHREYIVEQFERYKLRDANSDRVIFENISFDELMSYLQAREAADGQPISVTHMDEIRWEQESHDL
jgi:hypothetical protein